MKSYYFEINHRNKQSMCFWCSREFIHIFTLPFDHNITMTKGRLDDLFEKINKFLRG